MLLLQLTTDTTISANWVIAILLGIAVFLLARILNRIESKIESHDTLIANQDKRLVVLETKANKV